MKTIDYTRAWYVALRNDKWDQVHVLCMREVSFPETARASQEGFEQARHKLDRLLARHKRFCHFKQRECGD
ncbi:MAG: hypothetical protein PHX68_03000 [Alphaproteobacteria bacterium]|nr:hypothetical protein [Alphaproteobacteria bacterium]